jgi:WD40 repeat protein
LIKLWSLRDHSELSRSKSKPIGGSRSLFGTNTKGLENESLDVLAGHGGRILCLETAWNGERLVSGATDRTIKFWDLSNQSGGRCLQTIRGHSGWITHAKFWGRNNVISASSDRSIMLWDTRSTSLPLFVLRYHNAPVSDLFLESRTSNLLASAGSDGSIGTWDFRMISSTSGDKVSKHATSNSCIIRQPLSQMYHSTCNSGPTMLARGVHDRQDNEGRRSIISVNADNVIKEWDMLQGNLLHEDKLQCGKVSSFKTFTSGENFKYRATNDSQFRMSGMIAATWDGAVKLRYANY